MSVLMIPDMTTPTLRIVEVTLMENPVCWKKVLKIMPSDSPQFVMHRTTADTRKNSSGVLGSPTARSARREKRRQLIISNGTSQTVYARKNDVVLYARSSFSL